MCLLFLFVFGLNVWDLVLGRVVSVQCSGTVSLRLLWEGKVMSQYHERGTGIARDPVCEFCVQARSRLISCREHNAVISLAYLQSLLVTHYLLCSRR